MFLYSAVRQDIIHGCQTLSRGNPSRERKKCLCSHTQQKKTSLSVKMFRKSIMVTGWFAYSFDALKETVLY